MEVGTVASWGIKAGSYTELGVPDAAANPPEGYFVLSSNPPASLACYLIVRTTRSSMGCVEDKRLELKFSSVSCVGCVVRNGNLAGQDSNRRSPISSPMFLDRSSSLPELGAFITIAGGNETGKVGVVVDLHDGTQLCKFEFTSGSAAEMFCHLIVGAIQLHDPEAIIVVQNDRDS